MKKKLIYLIILIVTAGCTKILWEKPVYQEDVKNYSVVSDRNLLIMNGKGKNSYIFDISTSLKEILLLGSELQFVSTYKNFEEDEQKVITGIWELFIDLPENSLTSNRLRELGFVQTEDGLNYQTQLNGKVYVQKNNFTRDFDGEQYIHVIAPPSKRSQKEKVLLTPFAVLADVWAAVAMLAILVSIF